MLVGCKSKERVIKEERIERYQVDTIRVPGESSVLTGTLRYIHGSGIVIEGVEQKNTPGIRTSVSIHGDTLRVEAEVEEKAVEVVKQEVIETMITTESKKSWFDHIREHFEIILFLLSIILLFLFLLKRR